MKKFGLVFLTMVLGLAGGTSAVMAGNIAVIVVDVQGDFTTLKKGSLAVGGTDKAFVDEVQKATKALSKAGFLIFATQDWHPRNHVPSIQIILKKRPLRRSKSKIEHRSFGPRTASRARRMPGY